MEASELMVRSLGLIGELEQQTYLIIISGLIHRRRPAFWSKNIWPTDILPTMHVTVIRSAADWSTSGPLFEQC
jgi:hypothetical protein